MVHSGEAQEGTTNNWPKEAASFLGDMHFYPWLHLQKNTSTTIIGAIQSNVIFYPVILLWFWSIQFPWDV